MTKTFVNFTAEQVLAALSGEVVVVREAVKAPAPYVDNDDGLDILWLMGDLKCPYDVNGGSLWVRETWYYDSFSGHRAYKASIPNWEAPRWKSPVTMPRWASRLNVTVKSVTIEQGDDSGWEWVVEMVKEKNNATRK